MDNAEPDGRRRPPEDVLPAIVPAGRFLIRTERLIDALSALDQPLPPPEPGTLSVFAPQAGSGRASCPLDGRAIAAAAAAAQPYWR